MDEPFFDYPAWFHTQMFKERVPSLRGVSDKALSAQGMNERLLIPESDLVRRLGLQRPRRMSWMGKRIITAGMTLTALTLAFHFFHSEAETNYVTAPAVRGSLAVKVSATGTLQPKDQVDVGAEISGRVDAVNVNYNDEVKKGDLLAVINTDAITAQLAQSRAALSAARANLMSTEATVKETGQRRDRARRLYGLDSMSLESMQTAEADYDRAVAAVAKAAADVESSTAQVAVNKTALSKTSIRAPIDGVVLDRKVEPGQTVAASFQTPVLFTLASDLSQLQLKVDIDEANIGLVHEGQTATFSVDALPLRRFDAKLVSLRNAPKTQNGVVTFQGVLAVDNSEHLLRPGLTATVDILVAESTEAVMVPNRALRFSPPAKEATAPPLARTANGESIGRVWLLEAGKPIARDVKTGRTDGRNTEVLSGDLKPGDLVVTDLATLEKSQ